MVHFIVFIYVSQRKEASLMLKMGILNPQVNSLLSRIRHTNLLVIADRGFPYLPSVECVDIALVDNIPTVFDVFLALRENFVIGNIWLAEEFLSVNGGCPRAASIRTELSTYPVTFESHTIFKQRAGKAIGPIRTGDALPYSNIIVESA